MTVDVEVLYLFLLLSLSMTINQNKHKERLLPGSSQHGASRDLHSLVLSGVAAKGSHIPARVSSLPRGHDPKVSLGILKILVGARRFPLFMLSYELALLVASVPWIRNDVHCSLSLMGFSLLFLLSPEVAPREKQLHEQQLLQKLPTQGWALSLTLLTQGDTCSTASAVQTVPLQASCSHMCDLPMPVPAWAPHPVPWPNTRPTPAQQHSPEEGCIAIDQEEQLWKVSRLSKAAVTLCALDM